MAMGSGGGSGGNDNVLHDNPVGGAGGCGGGIILLQATTISITGTLSANGEDGVGDGTTDVFALGAGCGGGSTDCYYDYSGAGGGGSGGSIAIITDSGTANSSPACPTPAAFDAGTSYPVHNGSGDNYYNYCNYMVTSGCTDMCTGALAGACRNECTAVGARRRVTEAQGDEVPGGAALSYRGGFGGAGVSATDASRRAGDGGAGLYSLSQLQATSTPMRVFRYTQQAGCGTRNPQCSTSLGLPTPSSSAHMGVAVDLTGFTCAGCAAGYYQSGSSCAPYGGTCANGDLIAQGDRTQQNHCGTCDPGYFLSSAECHPYGGVCTNGVLLPQAQRRMTNHCDQCDAGYTKQGTYPPVCNACLPGTITAERGTSPCVDCIAGQYQNQAAQDNCIVCADGYYSANAGSATCTTCGDGYEPNGCTAADMAAAGTEAVGIAEDGCDGTGWSNTECTNVGNSGTMHGPWGNDVRTVSKTFPLASGVSSCTVSWRSWGISSRDNEIDSVLLDGNQVWSMRMNTGTSGRTADAKANWANYEQSYCWAGCNWYRYVDVSHSVPCSGSLSVEFRSAIDQGESDESWAFQNFAIATIGGASSGMSPIPASCTGSKTQCDICPIGKASHNGDAKCVACVPGYFAATTGTRDCAACAAGKKQPQSEQGGCVDCAPGKYQQTQAQTVCHNCNVGRVAPTAGMPTCDLCVPGKVMPSTGQTRCNDCRIGEYQPNHAQTHCPLCAPGWVTPREGMPTCDACARGKYQDHSGQGTCIDCFMGYVAPNEAQPTCDACHPGEFMDERGQRHCKDCAQPAGAYPANAKTFTSYDSPSHGPATANGFFTNYYAAAICTAWTECQPGHHIAFGGSATVDRTCVPCEPEHWSKSSGCNGGCDTPDQINEPVCTEWSVCPGNHAADYQDGDHGLTVLGTPTTDAVCTPCAEGSITIIDDFYSPCYNLLDIDGDSKYDRFIYDDLRHQGQRARRLGRGPYVPEADFDRHVHPDTGGEYDRCPFDPMNDEDGDGICALRTPPRLAHFVDNDANRFYAPGGSRQDHCPLDSDNDKDKDGLCDDVDRKVVTWDFTSANLVGWKDATCDGEPYHLGAADDACPEPTDFAVAAPERAVPALEIDAFGNDYRMSQMCDFSKGSDHRRRLSVQAAEMTAETELAALPAHEEGAFVIASFDLEEVITCDGLCQDHGMVCTAAVGGARHSRFTPFYNFAGPYTYDSDSANSVRRGVCDGDAVWDETYNKCGCPDDVCADQDACESVCGAIGDCAMFEFLEEAVSGGMRCWMIADADVDVEASCDPTVDFCMMLDVSGAACPAGQWLNEQSRCVHPPANFDTVRGCPAAAARGECFDEWTASNCALSCNNACDEVDMDAAQGDCGAFATRLMCKCEPDPRPMKLESWSQHNTCDSCYASTAHDDAVTGTMEREITIKKNTLTFALKGEQSLSKFVKLTIKNTKANQEHKAYKDQPFIMETPDATDGDWYPVNWDLSEFVGRKAKIEVTDVDPNGGVSVDEFTWFSERSSCLPSCMAIRDGICSGETCFYFENDNRAYVNVKQISDLEATYCRQGPLRDGGSPIGGGIREMWIDNGPNPVLLGPDGEEISGGRDVAIARTDSLRSDVLPRCFNIELKGSHISVTVAEGILGDDKPRRSFAYAPAPQLSEQAHCVYPTLKARCVAHSKPSAAFDEQKAVLCNPMIYRPTCFDQCYSLHCPFDDEQACGNSKAFQDCATCCDNNSNEASGCFRRRRRLGSKGAGSKATMLLNEDESTYTDNECAAACLDMDGCIGFKVEKGACMLTDQCGKENNDGTFERGTWHIHIEEEVMVGGKRQRKRLRKKRRSVPQPPTPGGPETPALCSNDCDGHPCAYCDETGCCTSDAEGSYCRNQNPTAAVTCSGADPEGTVDDNGMPVCCQAMTAECGACKNGLTTDGFCNACAFHGLNALECDDCASIMPVTPSGECPVGMRIVGNPGADIGGCGLQGCGERYDLTTIDQCAQRCQSTAGCNAINWADFGQDRNHVGQQVCTLYTQDQPTSTWGNQQLFCAYELTVGGTQDRYGCIGSAGYVYCHSSQRCQRPWEEDCLDEIVPPHMPEPEPTCEACHASAVYDHLTIHGAPMPFKVNDDGTYDVPRDCSVGLAELAEYGLVNLRDDFYDGCSGDETYDCNMDTAMALLDVCDYDTGRISIPVPCPEPPTPFPTAPGGEIETTDCEPAWDEGQNFFGINRHYYEGHMALFEVGREIIADGTSYYIDAMNLPGNCNSAVALVYVANDQSCADGSPWVNTPECGFGGALTATLRAGMTWSLPAEPVDPCTDGYFASPDLNDIGGCGLQSCGERYSLYNIDQCAARCNALDTCLAYSWAELGEDRNHADQKVCTLYDSVTPNQNWAGTDGTFSQLFCAVPELVSEAPLILDGTPLQPLILDGTPLNPNAEPCRVMEPASGNGGDCWELTPWLEANGLPASDCSKYFDTYGGGRGCRIEDGRCDGFADEEYTECV
jgi:hypothetical protein